MQQNRILEWLNETRTPVQAVLAASQPAFAVCPIVLMQPSWQPIYQAAYEQALASARPSLIERAERFSWN